MFALLIVLSSGVISAAGVSERVLGCQANEEPYAGAGARLRALPFTTGSNYTACIRIQFSRLARANILYRIDSGTSRPLLQLDLNVEKIRVTASYQSRYFHLDTTLRPRRWYLVCITYDNRSNSITSSVDGRSIGTSSLVATVPARATNLTVGFIDPSWYPGISFIGNVTQFNLWDRILTSEELEKLAHCVGVMEGNVVSWGGEWEVKNVVEYSEAPKDLCYSIPPLGFQVFKPVTYSEGSYLCEALGGVLKTPSTLDEVAKTYMEVQEAHPECPLVWAGVTDKDKEGQWAHHHNKSLAVDLPWAFDEPNGLTYENCGGFDVDGLIDDACTSKRCPVCRVAGEMSFTLLGSCEELVHNMKFIMMTHDDSRFIGYGDYLIYHNGSRWLWINRIANLFIAEMIPARYAYPLGRQQWLLHQPVCRQERGTEWPLLLTVCREGQFSCDDGTCVALNRRCDLRYDCRDHSDEAECQLVRLPVDYKSSVAPRPGGDEAGRLKVVAEATLENIQVDTPGMILKVGFNLSLSWMETRATFINLKGDLGLNQIDRNQSDLWYPFVTFLNTVENEVTIIDQHTRTNVLRHTTPGESDLSLAQEVLLYPGWGNPLVSYRKYLSSFTCDFDLTRYPFDRQNCYLLLQLSSAFRDNLKWDESASWVKYMGNQLLLEYTVGQVSIMQLPYISPSTSLSGDEDYGSLLKVRVSLTRRFGYAVINIYLPSLIMAIVGYLTLFFVKDNFEVRVMTSLTTLLVLATISNQVASSLPKSSTFKLVDVWLLFCIFSNFLIIVFHIIIDLLLQSTENKQHTGGKIVLVSSGNHRGVDIINQQARGHRRTSPSSSSSSQDVCETLVNKMKRREAATSPLAFHWRWWRPQLTVRGAEKLARHSVAAIFFIFNVCYWLMAYTMD